MHEPRAFTGLAGSSVAWGLAREISTKALRTVVVCPREEDAATLLADTQFFLDLCYPENDLNLLPYPARPADLNPWHLEESHIRIERLNALHQLLESSTPVVVIASLQAIAQITLPKKWMTKLSNIFAPDMEVDRDEIVGQLVEAGYDADTIVEEKGSFAVRGSILDLFSPNNEFPVRFEFDGDRIESIRRFDPKTQRSLEPCDEAIWIPTREMVLNEEASQEALGRLKPLADSLDLPPSVRHGLEDALSDRRYLPSMDQILPIFDSGITSILDYVGNGSRWITIHNYELEQEQQRLSSDFTRVESEIAQRKTLASSPTSLSLPLADVVSEITKCSSISFSDISPDSSDTEDVKVSLHTDLRGMLLSQRKSMKPLAPLMEVMQEWRDQNLRTIVISSSAAGAQRIHGLISAHRNDVTLYHQTSHDLLEQSKTEIVVTVGKLSTGFRINEERIVFLTESEIFGERKHATITEISREEALSSMSELNPGDPIVHLDHGVGIYQGLTRIAAGGNPNDFLLLEYAGGDKLYLPVYRLNRIHKYIGADGGKPHVDRLGNPAAWERATEKAKRAVEEMAQELIQLYAIRKVAKGIPVSPADEGYLSFEADFPFDETRDQIRTLNEVSQDLGQEKPMDRLVCGDVGFGKTEIALRAAFRTAMDGKQVAILVPTTILAQQHFETFEKRFKPYPIRVDFLSRFKSSAEQKKVVARLQDGSLDIVIGTHRLLSKDVSFSNLGLLVIDEEHRFGVKHKEQIKRFRNQVHVLTLTATPIPRTLQLSMAGIRDLSVINTPPLDRKAIATYLVKSDDGLIRNVILKELARGGQVFFVHNRVETIHAIATHLKKVVPEARIGIGHGQMTEKALEETMHQFVRKEFDVLLCTTIIESGLDIPSANTIIVNRADMFGLAQLYQLRGRVGRSDQTAYAYFLVPGEEIISRDALKRLKVLKNFTELGSGLKIALHDLEIRGAGNLLGTSQAGQIAAVGFELYTQLLEREVRRLKGEDVVEEIDTEIQCYLPAFLPDDYVPDTHERLLLYKKFSSIKSLDELDSLRSELVDRFGPIPVVTENLFRIVDLKIVARDRGVVSLKLTIDRPSIEFSDQAAINMDRLLHLVQKEKRITLRPDNRLILDLADDADSLEETKKILQALA